ncbi:hypothetical protein SDC9_154265 [bioreactor metagenome]|uniref:Transposase n=1 Tax=bioreactor metagenome TaxID=1076179 RepID=A0A645EZZ2_9ZZZZ
MAEKRYRSEMAAIAGTLNRSGVDMHEIADILGVEPEMMERWRRRHAELDEALKAVPAAGRVEAALLKRALGFRQEEASSEELVDKKSGELLEVLKRRVITKEVPPDVRALLFWLKNRCPERWTERPENSDSYSYEPAPGEADL